MTITIGLVACNSHINAPSIDSLSKSHLGQNKVNLSHGIDESAGGLPAYVIRISNAIFYLEKQGGGLSSMLDLDGVDWLGFNDTKGSGWKGEYRGFPNAVHKQDGNYFHAMNAGTDESTSRVDIGELTAA